MYSSFYDLEASSHVATIRQLHQVLEANLHVLEEVCVRITMTKDNLDQIINNLKFLGQKFQNLMQTGRGVRRGMTLFSIFQLLKC